MKLVIFGLTISSSWGNGHATLWRGLCRALIARGHHVTFFERDVPYYAAHRDLHDLPGGRLVLYREWEDALSTAQAELSGADVAMTTSYCPDAIPAGRLICDSRTLRVFYDLDTPVTFSRLDAGDPVEYIVQKVCADSIWYFQLHRGSRARSVEVPSRRTPRRPLVRERRSRGASSCTAR